MGARQSTQASSSQTSDFTPTNDSAHPTQPSPSVGASNSSSFSALSLAHRPYLEDSSPDEPPFNRLFLSHLFALRGEILFNFIKIFPNYQSFLLNFDESLTFLSKLNHENFKN